MAAEKNDGATEPPRFENQGGAANMDPSGLMRWLQSRYMRRLASPAQREKRRQQAERERQRAGSAHRVEYFHQVDDGYSQLAAQTLAAFARSYDVELVCHLVTPSADANAPEPELLAQLSLTDAAAIAPHYALEFSAAQLPAGQQIERAQSLLAGADDATFMQLAPRIGSALLGNDDAALADLASTHAAADAATTAARVAAGNARRAELGHYSGAMFHYAGEWYWGVDRIYHLENRLIELGTARDPGRGPLWPRPSIDSGPLTDDGRLTLEVYPSLRSPYTSIIFDRALELGTASGVKVDVLPVLPMVMRGVPATREKGRYIFTDTLREAETLGLDWGKLYDPIGEPVRRAYALYPWACEQGRGNALLSEFLRAAFFEGINTNRLGGLRQVVERAGLDWGAAKEQLGDTRWQTELERNRLAMYDFGSWGVPSFRLLDESGDTVLALWGQDRLWLMAKEIQRLLAERGG
ncbi:MAG: DsbA family protein [Pseudomonadota bacterium]